MPDLEIRRYEDADEAAVVELLAASLGKEVDDRYRGYFAWKHLQNPFGRSYMWVALDGDRIAGFRAFLRWRFRRGDALVDAVRAVDTVTDPEYRGRGIFRSLTLHALGEMERDGVALVFNTPNDQSRPGYLRMGWQEVGRLPVRLCLRPRARALAAVARARTAASPWSEDARQGSAAASASLQHILDGRDAGGSALQTAWSDESLRWRTGGFGPTSYRLQSDEAGRDVALFRCRERGAAMECTIGWASHDGAMAALRATGADYALGTAHAGRPWKGTVTTSRIGPLLTARPLDGAPLAPLSSWHLDLMDVELF